MKYPGHLTDETPPSWYHDRGQSYIEQECQNAIEDLASAIESEHWFGDTEKNIIDTGSTSFSKMHG